MLKSCYGNDSILTNAGVPGVCYDVKKGIADMKSMSLESAVASAAALAFVYALSILLSLRLEVILCLYLTSTTALLWMVFRILKDPVSTTKTFDESFYQDRDDLRPVPGNENPLL